MNRFALSMIVTGALIAGCGDSEPQANDRTSAAPPASSGSSGTISTGPKGERIDVPPAPQGSADTQTKPDPGDANDHSSPQHDSKSGKDGG